mmetsp:Transcript_1791/g.3062  ORF Transcript_1791/g.3062 Transcript_1791/m.3062 type:complete len:108 (+) Transcript_1791:1130-1453(+)
MSTMSSECLSMMNEGLIDPDALDLANSSEAESGHPLQLCSIIGSSGFCHDNRTQSFVYQSSCQNNIIHSTQNQHQHNKYHCFMLLRHTLLLSSIKLSFSLVLVQMII